MSAKCLAQENTNTKIVSWEIAPATVNALDTETHKQTRIVQAGRQTDRHMNTQIHLMCPIVTNNI